MEAAESTVGPRVMVSNERCCSHRRGGALCNCAVLRTAPFTAILLQRSQQNAALAVTELPSQPIQFLEAPREDVRALITPVRRSDASVARVRLHRCASKLARTRSRVRHPARPGLI